ncbi:MAG: bile acid:sodium symporter family protein [Verrucomicrobia bacterium]|nr:bile acid:sodium symporter family protein [Verrucomicrobiota bacterium]
MTAILKTLTALFPLWIVLGAIWAWLVPTHFNWFAPCISPALGVIMLGMGITLSFKDFSEVLKVPKAIGVGLVSQFTIMPLLGWGLASAFQLERDLAVGLILVSCCPGGTASNVIAYLARANVPLSVLLTMCSTFLAILLTPGLTQVLASEHMDVPAGKMLLSTLHVVLLPLIVGLTSNQFFPKAVKRANLIAPLVSVIAIVLIVSCIIGLNKEKISTAGAPLFIAVLLLHVGGFGLGYLVAKMLKYPEVFRRTLAIEVGMQNSGLGSALAKQHLPPAAAAPCAISAVYHCILGSLLAAYWRTRPPQADDEG